MLGIAAGKLVPGEILPSVRNLAADLGINFHTVNKAYSILCDEGYIVMDRRKGAVIAEIAVSDKNFVSILSRELLLSAAEAVCHDMGENEFTSLCVECYRNAKGKSDHQKTKNS